MTDSPRNDLRHQAGEPGFRRASIALFAAGLATFALLYTPQALLPELSHDFSVSAGTAALTLAVTTATLGLSLLGAGWLSDAWGRTRVMRLSILAASVLGIAAALAPNLAALLAVRGLEGVALAGLPAVAMAYLTEEIHPLSLGRSIGLYIGGNAIGGMAGRLLAGVLADIGGWRLALAGVGLAGLACAVVFARLLPPSARFVARPFEPRRLGARLKVHLTEPGLLRLDAIGALLMGCFVAVFNAIGFRLEEAPYHLGPTAVAAIFLVYPIGSFSSAWAGRLADRLGRRRVLPAGILLAAGGLLLTTAGPLPVIVVGIAVLTAGFFAGHSVASSWIGRRAHTAAAQASALYLLAYYAGSSVAGPAGGVAWTHGHWGAVVLLGLALLAAAFAVALRLRRTPPLAQQQAAVAA